MRPRTSTPRTYAIISKIYQGSVLQSGTVRTDCQDGVFVHARVCPSNLGMGRNLLRTVKCRGDGNCGYHSLLYEICHLRGQVRTNTAVSASISCQRCSTYVFYLRHFCFYTCMPLCTPVAQASVYILVHYAKHHMDTCVEVCWALCAMY